MDKDIDMGKQMLAQAKLTQIQVNGPDDAVNAHRWKMLTVVAQRGLLASRN